MRIIAIVNQKGGSGKTTTSINLAAIYAARGLRTLLVDLDPQSHCAAGLGVPDDRIECTIAEGLLCHHQSDFDPDDLLWEVSRNLDLAPATMRLAGLEAPGGGLHELADKDKRLAGLLARVRDRYDRCVIDCPPMIGLLTYNAMRAAREALIPVETGYFAMKGAQRQWKTIRHLIERIDRSIAVHILPTIHNPESRIACDVLDALKRDFAGQILPLVIHHHEVLREAIGFGQPIVEYAPDSKARLDYERLAEWLERHTPQDRPQSASLMNRTFGTAPAAPSTRGARALSSRSRSEAGSNRAAEMVQRVQDLSRRVVEQNRTIEQIATEPIGDDQTVAEQAPPVDPAAAPIARFEITAPRPNLSLLIGEPQQSRSGASHGEQAATVSGQEAPDRRVAGIEVGPPVRSEPDQPAKCDSKDGDMPTDEPESLDSARADHISSIGRHVHEHVDADSAASIDPRPRQPRPRPQPRSRPCLVVESPPAENKTISTAEPDNRCGHLYGVRTTSRGVLFVQPADVGRHVVVAGDFNGWSVDAAPMRLNPQLMIFEMIVPVDPGEHEYRLIVDGCWCLDAHNPNKRTNSYGETNSVLTVAAPPLAQPARVSDDTASGGRATTSEVVVAPADAKRPVLQAATS